MTTLYCWVCGEIEFDLHEVLWQGLIEEWELSPVEVEYVNRQQGLVCKHCGNNLRSIALAKAIMGAYDYLGTFSEFVRSEVAKSLRVLEINEAGGLTKELQLLPQHQLVKYPEWDMHHLDFPTESFDLIVHSDTLEHIQFPVDGLKECRRVLAPSGCCIYTVPVVVDRLTRSRVGMSPSYHGSSSEAGKDLLVWTEFGSDFWKYPFQAGFLQVTMHNLEYPAAMAIEASH